LIVAMAFREWLKTLSNGEAGLLSVAVTFAISGTGWLARQSWRRRKRNRQARIADVLRKQDEKRADFLRGEAPLGSIDHGVIGRESLSAIGSMVAKSIPIIAALYQELFVGDTIRVLTADDDAEHRESICKQLAEDIYPSVAELESTAAAITPRSMAFVEAYRVLIQKRDLTSEERQILKETGDIFSGGLADTFRKYLAYVTTYRQKFVLVQGKQRDLTRMAIRLDVALAAMEDAARTTADFCAGEMKATIDKILKS
jgi:hypothetical protein